MFQDCPLCNRAIHVDEIEHHVNTCLDSSEQGEPDPPRTRGAAGGKGTG